MRRFWHGNRAPGPRIWGNRPRGTPTRPMAFGNGDLATDLEFPVLDPLPAGR
jgi:hypothetical protein